MYTDPIFNSLPVVYSNLYQNFLILAMKMLNYTKAWGVDPDKHRDFILGMSLFATLAT
jgi:hypothetical protein